MSKFEKIKTAADKRLALDKRGFETPTDYKSGDVLVLSEKLDGFNASFDTAGKYYSRSGQLPENMQHHKKLIPFKEMVTDDVVAFTKTLLPTDDEYQIFGEFMVTDRIVQYNENVYDSFYIFDVKNLNTGKYLGILEADKIAEQLQSQFGEKFMRPNIIDDQYVFTSYVDLEKHTYQKELDSEYGVGGIMEGIVAVNQNGLRAKIVNKAFKETQREVVNTKAHTKAVQWVNTYLTQNRVSKIVKNLLTEGEIDPNSPTYFVKDLAHTTQKIWEDILEESTDTPEFAGNDMKNIRNKIEAKARLTMVDEKNYGDYSLNDGLQDLSDTHQTLVTDENHQSLEDGLKDLSQISQTR